MTCTELSASLTPTIGRHLVLEPSKEDYKVSRWNETDIVAFNGSNIGCGMGHTLKILLKDKRVLALDAPTEPVTDKTPKVCTLTSSYELKDGNSLWTNLQMQVPKAKVASCGLFVDALRGWIGSYPCLHCVPVIGALLRFFA